MTISLTIFLYVYFAVLAVFLLFFLFIFSHLLKYSFLSFTTFFISFIVLAMLTIVLFETYTFASVIDWNATIDIPLPEFKTTL